MGGSVVGQAKGLSVGGAPGDRLVSELSSAIAELSRWGPDFYRAGGRGTGKLIVPESVLSAFLGYRLEGFGWRADREALQGHGRVDLKLTRDGQTALVETKIWGRNDYREIQEQVEGYWCTGVDAAAVVMFHHGDGEAFIAGYRARCLTRPGLVVTERPVSPPVLRRFRAESVTSFGFRARVEHLLVRIPGARRSLSRGAAAPAAA